MSDIITDIVTELRDHANDFNGGSLENPDAWPDLYRDAADMLEFFFGQMQKHSIHMDGIGTYRLANGWPMTKCQGRTKEEAVRNAMAEVKRAKEES